MAMTGLFNRLWRSSEGAVAPLVALALTALIAVGGLAFDYAHLAAMDTELQDAADHAALAAATQLDGADDSQTRATTAANDLIVNQTRFARKDSTHTGDVAVVNVEFFSAYISASSNTAATDGTDSNFVRVTVDTRAADYALTPIVGALYGSLDAKAVAGVSSSVCGVVPFFVCNPGETAGNTEPREEVSGLDPGFGMVMAQGGTQWGPGNFGFLDQIGNGASGVAEALASDTLFGNCAPTSGVTTETGNILNAVRDSLNVRFDIKPTSTSACPKGQSCSPSSNVVKDLTKTATGCTWNVPSLDAADVTTASTNNTPNRYFPRSNGALPSAVTPKTMGLPRDICHYFLTDAKSPTYALCAGNRVGDGTWDREAYFRTNHPGLDWKNTDGLGASVTRYQTYLWEVQNDSVPTTSLSGTSPLQSQYGPAQNQCLGPGLVPDAGGSDRRRITAAVINCHAAGDLNGKQKKLTVAGYVDVFLVEPSIDRKRCNTGTGCTNPNATFTMGGKTFVNSYGSRNDIYVEVIGASGTGEGGAVPQITRRAIPRLIE